MIFRTARREIEFGKRPLIMGILNVTPDSFSDGDRYLCPEEAVTHAQRMVEEGADLLDIGAESTRPGSEGISAASELERLTPVMRLLGSKIDVPISIDTTKAEVAEATLALGAEIINDITALRGDDRMADVVARAKAGVILMHMRGTPKTMQQGFLEYPDLMGEIVAFLRDRIAAAIQGGIAHDRIMVDPGIGFGKKAEDNMRIMMSLKALEDLNRPVLVGPSRKGFIGLATGEETSAGRIGGTAATVAVSILKGADIVRVHDVRIMRSVADMAYALRQASQSEQ